MTQTPTVSKFILTVQVGEQADEVEETLMEAAEALNGRLTRTDATLTDKQDARGRFYYRRGRSRTLRKLGFLA